MSGPTNSGGTGDIVKDISGRAKNDLEKIGATAYVFGGAAVDSMNDMKNPDPAQMSAGVMNPIFGMIYQAEGYAGHVNKRYSEISPGIIPEVSVQELRKMLPADGVAGSLVDFGGDVAKGLKQEADGAVAFHGAAIDTMKDIGGGAPASAFVGGCPPLAVVARANSFVGHAKERFSEIQPGVPPEKSGQVKNQQITATQNISAPTAQAAAPE